MAINMSKLRAPSNHKGAVVEESICSIPQISVSWSFGIQFSTADIIDGFVVDYGGTLDIFQST